MEILRAKTLDLRQTGPLSAQREANSQLNEKEALAGLEVLAAMPRRFVMELTSACNLNCLMCGRNARDFKPTVFQLDWLKIFEPMAPEVEEVTLMGWGEPTIHPQFPQFLKWAHHLGLRKYFCTNGMRLKELEDDIFAAEADIIAVSLDGADRQTNEAIRRGADFGRIIGGLERLTNRKARQKSGPWLNFVFTAMKSNLAQLPEIVRLAGELGLDEVKAVYFTAFEERLIPETLHNQKAAVVETFQLAELMAQQCGVALKLPHLEGEDPAGDNPHKTCYSAWRDLFLGSDGRFRPCMSTAKQFDSIRLDTDLKALWNSPAYQKHRLTVNHPDMDESCRFCYQSSVCNWNQNHAFIQTGLNFAPEWQADGNNFNS